MTLLRICAVLVLASATLVSAMGESYTLNGVVRDEAEEALPGVIVTVNDSIGGEQLDYAISEHDGSFSLDIESTLKSVVLEVGMLGYETMVRKVALPSKKLMIFDLKPAAIELKEVHVSAKPIRAQGDTLIYNVASFKSAADRSIEDVIKRMPGIRVLENGAIEYNGLPINKFYIENLDMLQGNYTMATRNVSADDIATVDVYENHQPMKVLENIEYSDKAAINLTLKKKSLLRPVGNIRVGGGYNETMPLWLGEGNMLLVGQEYQCMLVAKGSNTGSSYGDEAVERTGNVRDLKTLAETTFSENIFSTPPIERHRYDNNRSILASVNALKKLSDERNITANISYNNNRSDIYGMSMAYYYSGNNDIVTLDTRANSLLKSSKLRGKITFSNNTRNLYLEDQLSVTGSFTSNDYIVRGTNNVDQRLKLDNYSVTNYLNFTVRHGSRVWEISSSLYFTDTPDGGIVVYNEDSSEPYINQVAGGKSFYNTERTSMVWLIGRYASVGAMLTFNIGYNTFNSSLYAADASDYDGLNDLIAYKINTTLTPFYLWQNEKWEWRIDLPVEMIDFGCDDRIDGYHYNHHRPHPGIKVRVNFDTKKDFKLFMSGGYSQTTGGLRNFITTPIYTSYRALSTIGSGRLSSGRNIDGTAGITYRNALNAMFVSLISSAVYSRFNTMSVSDVSNNQTVNEVANRGSNSLNMNVMLNTSKRIKPMNMTLHAGLGWSFMQTSCLRNNLEIKSDVAALIANASVSGTALSDRIGLGLSAEYCRSEQDLTAQQSKTAINDAKIRFNLSVFPIKAIEIFGNTTYQHVEVTGECSMNPVFVNAGLRYKIKKWELEMKLNNLTNRRNYAYQVFSGPDLIKYDYRLRPAEVIASVRFSF